MFYSSCNLHKSLHSKSWFTCKHTFAQFISEQLAKQQQTQFATRILITKYYLETENKFISVSTIGEKKFMMWKNTWRETNFSFTYTNAGIIYCYESYNNNNFHLDFFHMNYVYI